MNDELRAAFDRLDQALQDARAACAAAGVPRPEEEPKTVTVEDRVGDVWRFASVNALAARMVNGAPMLCIRGPQHTQDSTESCETQTPLADIQRQAAAAGIELPPVTVNIDSYRWTAIERADCHVCDDGSLLTGIIGVAERYGEHTIHTSTLTPAQVLALCALAGWPKPEVRMVLTHCDGDPCTVDPCEDIVVEYDARWHATSIAWVPSPRDDGYEDADEDHIVRESVAQVEAMLDACKEGE